MMLVYRIEDQEGNGPWRVGSKYSIFSLPGSVALNLVYGISDWDLKEEWKERHPNPFYDKVLTNGYDYNMIFAFESIEQYHSWFSTEESRKYLHDCGFYLSVYETQDVIVGARQVVFYRDTAILVDTLCLFNDKSLNLSMCA